MFFRTLLAFFFVLIYPMYRRKDMKNFVIGILAFLVLALGGYLVYDKVIDKKDVSKEEPKSETVTAKQLDYFDTDIDYIIDNYIPSLCYHIEDFNNKAIKTDLDKIDIKSLLTFWYYPSRANVRGLESVTVTKAELDNISYILTGKVLDDYTYTEYTGNGITKQGDKYSITWRATGRSYAIQESGSSVTKSDTGFTYKAQIIRTEDTGSKDYGYYTFTFEYNKNKGLYHLTKIEKA